MIPFDEIVNTTVASFAAIQSLKTNSWVQLDDITSSKIEKIEDSLVAN